MWFISLALSARNSWVRIFESYEINSRLLFDTIGRESTPGRAQLSKASSRAWRSISYDKDLLSHGFSSFSLLLPSSRRRSLQRRRRSRLSYLYLSIFFSLHSRHAYVCIEYKGIKRGKRLYRELLRCLARRVEQQRKEKILSIAFWTGLWLSAKWFTVRIVTSSRDKLH